MWGLLGDPLSPLAPVSYRAHWTRGPRQLPGSSPQSIRTLLHPPGGVEVSSAPWGGGWGRSGRHGRQPASLPTAFGPYPAVDCRSHLDFRLLDAPRRCSLVWDRESVAL